MNPSMVFVHEAGDALPIDDESFNVITVCAAFHHFPDVDGFAQEAFHVLKKRGMMYVAGVVLPASIKGNLQSVY